MHTWAPVSSAHAHLGAGLRYACTLGRPSVHVLRRPVPSVCMCAGDRCPSVHLLWRPTPSVNLRHTSGDGMMLPSRQRVVDVRLPCRCRRIAMPFVLRHGHAMAMPWPCRGYTIATTLTPHFNTTAGSLPQQVHAIATPLKCHHCYCSNNASTSTDNAATTTTAAAATATTTTTPPSTTTTTTTWRTSHHMGIPVCPNAVSPFGWANHQRTKPRSTKHQKHF